MYIHVLCVYVCTDIYIYIYIYRKIDKTEDRVSRCRPLKEIVLDTSPSLSLSLSLSLYIYIYSHTEEF